jgi:DNA transformation protein and related proteins
MTGQKYAGTPMPVSDSLRDMLIEQSAPLGRIQIRRMFGVGGVFVDGLMFGLIQDDRLFLKVGASNRGMFEAEGMDAFVYTSKGKSISLSFWQAPERLYDDPDDLIAFSRAALAVATRAAAAKAKQRTRTNQQ